MCNLSQQIRMESEKRGKVKTLADLVRKDILSYHQSVKELDNMSQEDKAEANVYLKELPASDSALA